MRYRTWHLHVAALLPPIPPKFRCLSLHMNGSGAGSPCGPPIIRVFIRAWSCHRFPTAVELHPVSTIQYCPGLLHMSMIGIFRSSDSFVRCEFGIRMLLSLCHVPFGKNKRLFL